MGDPLDPSGDFDTAAARLRATMAEACAEAGPWPARVCAAIDAALRFAADDPDATRLLLVDSWDRGRAAAARREALLDHFAALLASGREQAPDAVGLPAVAEEFLVGAVAAVIADRLDATGEDSLAAAPALAAELSEYVLLPYVGKSRARAWARLRRAGRPRLLAPREGDLLEPIEFTDALGYLQGAIGAEARVVLNLPGRFFDCGFAARLERIETLAGDDGPVLLVFADGQGIALDPADFDCFLARWPGRPSYAWLELRLDDLLHLVIEPLADPE